MLTSYRAWGLSNNAQKVASEKYHGIRGPPEFIRGKRAGPGKGKKGKPKQTNLLLTSKIKAAEILRHQRTQILTFLFGEANLPGIFCLLVGECLSDNVAFLSDTLRAQLVLPDKFPSDLSTYQIRKITYQIMITNILQLAHVFVCLLHGQKTSGQLSQL